MLTLPDHFRILRKRIEPDDERAKAAKNIPAQVRDFLQKDEAIKTVDPHSRLVGSYARHTAIKDIKDVDIILLIAPIYGDQPPADVLETLFKALRGLPEALDDRGEVVVRRHQRRSVNIHLEKSDFDLDIVPAIALNDLTEPLRIPDKDWNEWVETHPLGYSDRLSELNDNHGEKMVPLVKLLKHWRDVRILQRNRRPKSYWMECMVYHRIANEVISTDGISYAQLFRDLLGSIYDDFLPALNKTGSLPVIPDPMLSKNIVYKWEREAFEMFMRRVEESHKWAARALEQNDESKAAELWQKVFGKKWFPLNADQEKAKRLSAAALAGNIFVTPTGRVLTERPSSASVQPLSQRFYGEG